jgi:hypothetical protein
MPALALTPLPPSPTAVRRGGMLTSRIVAICNASRRQAPLAQRTGRGVGGEGLRPKWRTLARSLAKHRKMTG